MTSRFLRRGMSLAAALAFLAAPSVGFADPIAIEGYSSGVFVNPSPSAANTTGVDTSHFQWGSTTGVSGASKNELKYTSAHPDSSHQFSVDSEAEFKLGDLWYKNGTTASGTNATGVDLKISLTLTMPDNVTQAFTFDLALNSTPNTNDPNASADYVTIQNPFQSQTITVGDTQYTLALLGFRNLTGNGFLNDSNPNSFHVFENGHANSELWAKITADVTPVPEPASIAIVAVAGLLGVGQAVRRRRSAASA